MFRSIRRNFERQKYIMKMALLLCPKVTLVTRCPRGKDMGLLTSG